MSILESPARLAALAAGKATFRADRSCVRGHEPVRYTNYATCVMCMKLHNKRGKATALGRLAELPLSHPDAQTALTLKVAPGDVWYLKACAALLISEHGRSLRQFLTHHVRDITPPSK